MYGGTGKLGRGGGGGRGGGSTAGKRNNTSNFPPPPLHRPSTTTAGGGRLSMGGGPRNRTTSGRPTATSASSNSASDETFNLVTGNPLKFAMIIRLAPDLVEEIKRVEAQGGTARIKFDANANNPLGNVIDVGGKDFRFTWSREMGDLCDIYEERQSGEDGNGLLVESGCPWRKLNVQRVLDESTKNHVKMRSEEAERKLKSRKAIVLDHGNPSMKSQMKALAAAEVNPWRMPFKQKKEPHFKKRKFEPSPVGGPPKSINKSGLSSTTHSKGRPLASPVTSPPEQSGDASSPFGAGNLTKGHATVEDAMPTQAVSKENAAGSERDMPAKVVSGVVRDKPVCKGTLGARPTDLRSMLISLLSENPKGMSLKALEKAIGDMIPNSVRQIEPIIKKIATFQAPGRYFLKHGVELGSIKKPLSESGSSPEDTSHQTPSPENNCDQIPTPIPTSMKGPTEELEEQEQINSRPAENSNAAETIDIAQIFGEKKVSDNSEGLAGSSSDSGSDSDSDSDSSDSGSDSGSHSRSRSKSRSPVGSGSGSSSDSESDPSSNSKEGSDEDVDIMTSDDDKEYKHKLQASEPTLTTSPIPWRTANGEPVHNGIDEKQDGHDSDIVEIEKDLPADEQEAEMDVVNNSAANREGEKPGEETKLSSTDHHEHQDSEVHRVNLYNKRENVMRDGFPYEQSDNFEGISRGKSKRVYDGKQFDDNIQHGKRYKAGNLTGQQISGGRTSLLSENPHNLYLNRPVESNTNHKMNVLARDGADFGLRKGYNQAIHGKSIADSRQSAQRCIDLRALADPPAAAERPGKHSESLGGSVKHSERSLQRHEGFPMQKNKNREAQGEDDFNEKKAPKHSKESGVGDAHLTPVDSHYKKQGELLGKFKEAGSVSMHTGFSPKGNSKNGMDRSPVPNERGSILRRELSDLELGELRDPLPEETPGIKKQFERKSSVRQSENKPTTSDHGISDSSKGKPSGKTTVDSKKPTPPYSNVGIPSNLDGLSKKRTPEHCVEGFARSYHGVEQLQPQRLSRIEHTEVGSLSDNLANVNSKTRHNEAVGSQGIDVEGYGDTHRKVPVSAQQNDTRRGIVPPSTKESSRQQCSTLAGLTDKQKEASLSENNENGQKRRESSSDENGSSFSKYEKEEPELKGQIKNFSQYKEYVQEYREKYDSYCSLNNILESYRTEFNKLGRNLETAKGKDMEQYYNIVGQLRESYRQCGMRHKRLKKIFVVLHEEVKHLKQMIKDYAVSYTKE